MNNIPVYPVTPEMHEQERKKYEIHYRIQVSGNLCCAFRSKGDLSNTPCYVVLDTTGQRFTAVSTKTDNEASIESTIQEFENKALWKDGAEMDENIRKTLTREINALSEM